MIAAGAASLTLLATTAASGQLPLPPPDGPQPEKARIAFVADGKVHTIAADGSDRRRVTAPPRSTFDENPAWSPDGATLAFTRFYIDDEEENAEAGIWLAGADGSNQRPLTQGGGNDQSEPTWSPDGQRIAFARIRESRGRVIASIVSVRSDGGDARVVYTETNRLDDEIAYFTHPAWSPAGDRILFTRTVIGNTEEFEESLHAVPAAGGKTAPRIVRGGDEGAWAPGGDRIAYTLQHDRSSRRPCLVLCDGAGEIYAANADGGGRTRLTKSRANDASPSWSADGQRIAFQSDRNSPEVSDEEGPPELYSMRADGSCVTWLTNGTAHSEWPAFGPGAGRATDPGGCGAVPREPLVETDTRKAEAFTRYGLWWLGRVAPNGLLLDAAEVGNRATLFVYDDCGRFDPAECGEPLLVMNRDLCAGGRPLPRAGGKGNPLSIFRGALFARSGDREVGYADLYTGRTRIVVDTASA
ncbi:MAG TPA: hypothetical protein VF715_20005, partial [Thermoleophilaceae bacterium]